MINRSYDSGLLYSDSTFSIGEVSIQMLYPLILSVVTFLHGIVKGKLINLKGSERDDQIIADNYLVVDNIKNIFYMLTGFLLLFSKDQKELIQKRRAKQIVLKESELASSQDHSLFKIESEASKKVEEPQETKNVYLHLFMVCVIYFIKMVVEELIFYSGQDAPEDAFKLTEILTTIALTKAFFKLPLFRHKIVAIIVEIITLLSTQIILSFITKSVSYNASGSLLLIIFYFTTGISYVYEKWIIVKKLITPTQFIFLEGTFGLLTNGFFILIFAFLPCGKVAGEYQLLQLCKHNKYIIDFRSLFTVFKDNFPWSIFYFISFGLLRFGIKIFCILTLFYFSPIFRSVPDMIVFLYKFIMNIILGEISLEEPFLIFSIFALYIVCFGFVLIFLEIVLVSMCGMDENTKGKVMQRALKDYKQMEKEKYYGLDSNNTSLNESSSSTEKIYLNS